MQERYPLDPVIDPIIRSALANEDLFDLGLAIRSVARRSIAPRAAKMEEDHRVPDDVVKSMADNGFFALGIPENHLPESLQGAGIGDRGCTGACLVAFETGAGDLSTSLVPLVTTSLFGKAVQVSGNDAQRARILPLVATGEIFGCYGLTEAVGSSYSRHMQTRADPTSSGFHITGSKVFITEADRRIPGIEGSRTLGVVYARLGDDYVAFLVPHATGTNPGYTVVSKERKAGILASATCQLALDVEVPEDHLLGIGTPMEKKGLKGALVTLGNSRPTIAAQALGNATAALQYMAQYAADTPRGDGARLLDIEGYRVRLADLVGRLGQGISYLFTVSRAIDREDADALTVIRTHSSTLKRLGSYAGMDICYAAMEMLGGAGYLQDHPLERRWRDSGVVPIYEGQNDVQLDVAGRGIDAILRPK